MSFYFSEVVAENGTLTSEILLQLNAFFGPTLRGALDLIDNGALTKVTAETSQLVLYRVKSFNGVTYVILPASWRCSCPSWMQTTWMSNESITCKHVLSVQICQAMSEANKNSIGNLKESTVSNEVFAQMMANMD